jgi:hypothetical protein
VEDAVCRSIFHIRDSIAEEEKKTPKKMMPCAFNTTKAVRRITTEHRESRLLTIILIQ